MSVPVRWRPWLGLALWAVLALPPVRHTLEATMTLQMLVQIPLLALAGWWVAPALPRRWIEASVAWNRSGISGILLASFAAAIWMLPRMLDAALEAPAVALAKFASVPLLVGLPLAVSWPRAGFVVRGVWLVEIVATAFRLGWMYLVSPVRLCSNYLLDDQQRLGQWMLAIGVLVTLVLAWKLMAGRIDVDGGSPRVSGPRAGGADP